MHLNFKNYQISKTRQYVKKNKFLLLAIGANQNSQNWINVEQELYKIKLKYHKINNNITKKLIKNSIYENSINTINSTFFFISQKSNQIQIKISFINNLDSIIFNVICLSLNNFLYAIYQLHKINSLTYRINILVFYQFLLLSLKLLYKIKKISKQCDLNT